MNKIDKKPNYKKIYKYVEKKFKKSPFFHYGVYDETFFTPRVFEMCKELMKKLDSKINKEILLTSALLHDIGKTDMDFDKLVKPNGGFERTEWKTHAKRGVPIARRYLRNQGHSKEFIDEVAYLIENHDKRRNKMNNRTIELEILQDADILADSGLIAIARSFTYSGQFKRNLLDNIRFMRDVDSRAQDPEYFNLKISRQIAKKLHSQEVKMIKELSLNLESELFN